MRLFEFLGLEDHLLKLRRQRPRRAAHHGAHLRLQLVHLIPRLVLADLLLLFTVIPKKMQQVNVDRRGILPIFNQVEHILRGSVIDLVEGPSGSSDDVAIDPGPVDLRATGRYSPSETGSIPDAA